MTSTPWLLIVPPAPRVREELLTDVPWITRVWVPDPPPRVMVLALKPLSSWTE
jgi:hypothetical protein